MTRSTNDPTQPGRRLALGDPFHFPSDTDFRFALLIASVAASALFVFRWLYHGSQVGARRYSEAVERCFRGPTPAADASLDELIAANQELQACMAFVNRETALWMIVGTLLLFATALVLYLLYPNWKTRRGGFEPLSDRDAPQVLAHLQALCQRIGLSKPPRFLWNPLDASVNGLAFGRWGGYRVGLSGGLVTAFVTDRPTFDAVVLHELAHIRNGDVSKAYWSMVIWYAFLGVALAPLAIDLLDNTPLEILRVAWRVAGLAALVYLIRSGVLRARELFADARLAEWYGHRSALKRALASLLKKPARWRPRVFATHPGREERLETLAEPERLLRFSAWDAVAVGIAGALTYASLHSLLGTLFYNTGNPMLPTIGAALVVAGIAVGVIGLGIWRGASLETQLGGPGVRAGPLGLAFGAGLVLGRPLALEHFIEPYLFNTDAVTVIARVGFALGWALLVLSALYLFFRWIHVGARVWVVGGDGSAPPRVALAVGLGLAAITLAAWLGPALWLRGYDASTQEMILAGAIALLAIPSLVPEHALTHLSLVSLWGFPLAGLALGSFRRDVRRREISPPWRKALLAAGVAAGLFALAVLAARLALHFGVSERRRASDAYKLLLYGGHLALAFTLQAVLGVIVAARARALPALTALFSTHAAGAGMAAVTLLASLPFGGSPDLPFAWSVFSHITVGGALIVLPLGLVSATLARRLRRASVHRSGRTPGPPLQS